MRFVYPCDIVLDEEERAATGREAYTVTFPDVNGATTGGWSWQEALENAEDALVAALGSYYYLKQDLPLPSAVKEGQQPIALRPVARGQGCSEYCDAQAGHDQGCPCGEAGHHGVGGAKALQPRSPLSHEHH